MTRSILITGASKGIGRAIAQRLAGDGFTIIAHCGTDSAGAEATIAALGDKRQSARILQFDISNRDQCRTCLDADVAAHGAYYGVVLNAGIARDNAFPALSDEDWDAVIDTDLGGFYNVLRPVVMPMVSARQGGRIVALSSLSGIVGNRGQVNYSAAKAGIIGAAKALAVELARRKITVNCVAPGLIDTPMIRGLPIDDILKTIPMQRIGTVDEVAAVVGFLCSDSASYVTRQVISVNGGLI